MAFHHLAHCTKNQILSKQFVFMSNISNLHLVETIEERHEQFLYVHHAGEGQLSIK